MPKPYAIATLLLLLIILFLLTSYVCIICILIHRPTMNCILERVKLHV